MCAANLGRWAMTCLIFASASACAYAGVLPRYTLEPGKLITYEETQIFKGAGEESRYRTTWRLWVIGRNQGGSWRLIAREGVEVVSRKGSSPGERETVTFARFDLKPDGTVPDSPELGTRFDPSWIFPPLPGDERAAFAGWLTKDDRDGRTIRCQPVTQKDKDPADRFDFTADVSSFREKIYEGSDRRTYHFDRTKGLISRGELEQAFGAHVQEKGTGTLELKSIEQVKPADLTVFVEQMDRYFEAHEAYLVLLRKARTSGGAAEALLKKGRAILADGRAEVTIPEAVAVFDDQLKNHDKFQKHYVDEARRFAELIGHASPSWEIKDLEGRTHSLDQYRGKVLVLDFWYRGCGWCMRAMPQVKHVASHYRGRPVAVFGMNNDRKEDDAKFVVQKMQLDYPVLRSEDIPAKYGVTGFPTVIVIDQQGMVADIHLGYSPRLFDDVTAAVDRLLAHK
jgi:thiol-disulfide isomerase/thioredoxin